MITTEEKGSVVVHTCVLPAPIDATVVRIDVREGGDVRFRLRPQAMTGVEARLLVTERPHYQQEKWRKGSGIYALQHGWIALLTRRRNGEFQVRAAFAHDPRKFFLMSPAEKWYALYLPDPVAYSYHAGSNETGRVRPYKYALPTEEAILRMYGKQRGLTYEEVQTLVRNSMTKSP